jgi:tetratricopeptide (TPR) repeat protein
LKALEMDDSLPQAHTTLGGVLHEFDWKFDESEKEFKRAIELDPNYATAHHWYAELLLTMRRVDESLIEIRRAQECDPLSLIIQSIAGLIHALRGDYAAAEAQLKKTVEMDPNFSRGRIILAGVYERQGRFDEAIREYEKHAALIGMPAETIEKEWAPVKQAAKAEGAKGYYRTFARLAEEQLKTDPENAPPYFAVGSLFARAGDPDRAFGYFDKSLEQREPDILRIFDPELDPLRSDPRYLQILDRIQLRR